SGGATTLSIALPDSDTQLDVPSVLMRADADGYAFNFEDRDDERLRQIGEVVRRAADAPTVDVEPHVRILHRIGEAISATLDVDEVLRIALDALTHVTGHEISSLHLLSADGKTLHLRGDRGLRPRRREITAAPRTGRGLTGGGGAPGNPRRGAQVGGRAVLLRRPGPRAPQEAFPFLVCSPTTPRGPSPGALPLAR